MKIKTGLAIVTFFIFYVGFAQTAFQKNYGDSDNQWGNAVKQCFDKGYISVGHTVPLVGYYNIYVVKTDSVGDTLWTRRFGGDNMVGFDVIQTLDSNYVVSGYVNSSGKGILKKIDRNGSTVFTQTYTAGWIQSVQQTYDGGFICGGLQLYKTTSTGSFSWSVPTIGQIIYVIQAQDSNYVTLGFTSNTIYLRKTNQIGATIWTKSIPGTLKNPSNNCLAQTSDGGYIYTGRNINPAAALLVKTSANGDTLWTKVFSSLRYGTAVVQSADGGYVICGQTPGNQMASLKTNSLGLLQWSNIIAEGTLDEAKSIRETDDGGFILCGGTNTSSGTNRDNLLLVKTNASGNIIVGVPNCVDVRHNSLTAYPNPFSTETIISSEYLANSTLTVFNSQGQVVNRSSAIDRTSITLLRNNLMSGVYYLSLSRESKIVATLKLIITD